MKPANYFGKRENRTARVFRYRPGQDPEEGSPLDLRLDVCQHSLTGPEWGYGGSGPAQLAFAILADCLGDDKKALTLYQEFKEDVIAKLPFESWALSEDEIRSGLRPLTWSVNPLPPSHQIKADPL